MERRFERNFNKWREYDLLTCLIACVGLALAIVDWEYTRASAERIEKAYYSCKDHHSENFNQAECTLGIAN